MARIFKPPTPFQLDAHRPSVFLAGSIDMGAATDWQAQVERDLRDLDIDILNPRRDAWDSSWVQSIANPQFREQVEWELHGLERATWIAVHFAALSQAPVTMLEFGLFAQSSKMLVCCAESFWRRGNIEVVCARYGVPLVGDLNELVKLLRAKLQNGSASGCLHKDLAAESS